MLFFTAPINKIGINPYVFLPERVLKGLMQQAKKQKGPISVAVLIGGKNFNQTLVKYAGFWRLYLNKPMRVAAGKDVGDTIRIGIAYEQRKSEFAMPASLKLALDNDGDAKEVFDSLPPSRQKEINRYIANLKTPEAVERNVLRAVNFLKGKERFIGRDGPVD